MKLILVFIVLIITNTTNAAEAPDLFELIKTQKEKIDNFDLFMESEYQSYPLFVSLENAEKFYGTNYDLITRTYRRRDSPERMAAINMNSIINTRKGVLKIRDIEDFMSVDYLENNISIVLCDTYQISLDTRFDNLWINERRENSYRNINAPFGYENILNYEDGEISVNEQTDVFVYTILTEHSTYEVHLNKETHLVEKYIFDSSRGKSEHIYSDFINEHGIQLPSNIIIRNYKKWEGLEEELLSSQRITTVIGVEPATDLLELKIPSGLWVIISYDRGNRIDQDQFYLDHSKPYYTLSDVVDRNQN